MRAGVDPIADCERTPSYGFRIEGESIYHENFEPTGENASRAMLPRCRN